MKNSMAAGSWQQRGKEIQALAYNVLFGVAYEKCDHHTITKPFCLISCTLDVDCVYVRDHSVKYTYADSKVDDDKVPVESTSR